MGKLQPNFSFQKYEDNQEDAAEQFQYQLQQQHIFTANALNATVDDCCFFTRERQTSFTWIDGHPIWTKTLPTAAWTGVGTVNTIATGITAGPKGVFEVLFMRAYIVNGTAANSTTLNIPHVDVAVAANELMIVRNGTNIVITSGGTDYSAYSGNVTIYYLKY